MMFPIPDTWTGGSFDLLLHIAHGESRLKVVQAVWSWPKLFGPYSRKDVEPFEQQRIAPGSDLPVLYGEADLPNGVPTAFATYVLVQEKNAWVYALMSARLVGARVPNRCLSLGGPVTAPWAAEVSAWLFELAEHVYERARFSNGVIGCLTVADVDEFENTIVPEHRYYGYVAVPAGRLLYYPPNVEEPLLR